MLRSAGDRRRSESGTLLVRDLLADGVSAVAIVGSTGAQRASHKDRLKIVGAEPGRRSGVCGDVVRPLLHERAAALEQVAAPVGGLDAVVVDVRQGELADLARRLGALRRPVAEAGAKPGAAGREQRQAGDLRTAIEAMKRVPWTALAELEGDADILKTIDQRKH